MAVDSKHFTNVVHAGAQPEAVTGAIMTPIFMTSTYVQEEPGVHKGYDYSRADNPTRAAYEAALATIEGAKYGLAFSSGLAAEQAIVQLLSPGARVIVSDDVYGGTGRLFRRLYAKYGIDFQFIDLADKAALTAAMTPATKMIWVETPSNPTMKIIDVRHVAALAKKAGALTVVDNTFATPIFQSPLKLGADIVVHSTTKYIGGHSDMIGGALMTSDDSLFEQLKFIQFAAGAVPAPLECFLLHRSIKTLAVRMQQHERNAQIVATMLSSHPKVKRVYYPGLTHDPGHQLAKEQMSGYSGMVSFDHGGSYAEVVAFLQKLKVFSLAESLGGVESLVNHPERMTHASVPEDLRRKLGIGPQLIRLSVGIEHADDLINDLTQAL
ncbi:MAG: PLP-dependent transferase [Deltaproteobacteria bacterium]|nr:PLP-dependent transferase [Deltaproteobacteria bacterium]